jgi:hypothetical protein
MKKHDWAALAGETEERDTIQQPKAVVTTANKGM